MSDRKNRDVGRKKSVTRWNCCCWLCRKDNAKKFVILKRDEKKLNNG